MNVSKAFNVAVSVVVALGLLGAGLWVHQWLSETRMLSQVVERLSAESRVAEVLVTRNEYNEKTKTIQTTIKFLEYDINNNPLESRYFTFSGNIIQFQALVIRFEDQLVRMGDRLKGKSAYLFLKAFMLNGKDTQEFEITPAYSVPSGYKITEVPSEYEKEVWTQFWQYALNSDKRREEGIKSAQLEAPGTMFLPGSIYTLYIEHDGGLRIDSRPVPEIVKGENL